MKTAFDIIAKPAKKTAVKKAAKKAATKRAGKKSSYEMLIANGWGGLLRTMKPETIDKLKAM